MPVNCPFCETNTHGDHDKGKYPICERVFLTPSEAYDLLEYDKETKTVHVFIASPIGIVIGADWGMDEVKKLVEKDGLFIELCDPEGMARKMKHGISVPINKNPQLNRFLNTNEEKLKEFEEKIKNESSR